uniref:Isopentenyl transferase IPT4 n=1 Tax=Solanum tuberosum TaxID=4113 RepID=M1CJJ8_SOLTU
MYHFEGRITRCDGYYISRGVSRAAIDTIIEGRVVRRDRCMDRYVPHGSRTERQRIVVVKVRLGCMDYSWLVDEVRQIFIPDADYTNGIRWSNGDPEMAKFLWEEKNIDGDDESNKLILQASISSIKRNTRISICNQLDKNQRLINKKMWPVHHIIATDVFKEDRKEDVVEAWRNTVLQPCLDIVKRFFKNDDHNISIECT